MKITGKIADANIDFVTGVPKVTLSINEKTAFLQGYDELKDLEKLSIEIKPYRQRRSLDANAFFWAACTAIANALRTSKDEVYFDMLRRYGQGFVIKVPNKHIEMFKRSNKYYEPHDALPIEDKAQYFRVYLGSSLYNSEEMSILIDGVLSEIKEMGLDFVSEEEASLYRMESGCVAG